MRRPRLFDSIAHFFAERFGEDDSEGESSRHAETIRRGGTVLVVGAADDADDARAPSPSTSAAAST